MSFRFACPDEFSASLLLLSSGYTVAPRFGVLPRFKVRDLCAAGVEAATGASTELGARRATMRLQRRSRLGAMKPDSRVTEHAKRKPLVTFAVC
jgi:hypothetical protein